MSFVGRQRRGSRPSIQSSWSRRFSTSRAQLDEPSRHKRSGLLNYLMPFYLCPVLLPGTRESKSFYCILLMMSWWLLRAVPKPVLAFLPAVVLPLLDLMGHEQVASNYFSTDVLMAALLLWLVLVGDETPTVGRISYALIGRFGGRTRPLVALLTATAFVASLVLPQSLVAVLVTCLAERVCNFVRDERLHDASHCLERATTDDTAYSKSEVDTAMLYEELALALWKRNRAGLDDTDPLECWDAFDTNDADSPTESRQRWKSLMQRKASILKQPSKHTSALSSSRASGANTSGTGTPSGPRFANVPDDVSSEAKPRSGRLIGAKRRRQSFAEKPHVFEFHESSDTSPLPPLPPFGNLPSMREDNSKNVSLRKSLSEAPLKRDSVTAGKKESTVADTAPLVQGASAFRVAMASSVPGAENPSPAGLSVSPTESSKSTSPQEQGVRLRRMSVPFRRVSLASVGRPLVGLRDDKSRISLSEQNVVVQPARGFSWGPRPFKRYLTESHSYVSSFQSNVADDKSPEFPEERRVRLNREMLAALCVCGNMTSVAGSIASYWFMPAAEAIVANFDGWPLSFWSWTLITLPVSLAASALSSICVYYGSLRGHEGQFTAEAEKIMCYYAKLKLNQLERCKILELLVLSFWIGYSGIIFSCRLIQRRDLEIIFLSGIVLLASTAFSASSTFDARRCLKPEINPSVFRYKVDVDGDDSPDFESVFGPKGLVTITGKLPWSVIVIYGAASVITRVAETTGLARVAFGTEFWSQLPDFGKQALLTITSSLMAEFMNAAALCHAILPFVTHLSIGTEHGALYYCLPVAVGASLNTIMPVSLPLVMLHEAVPVTRKQLILTGAFVKTFVIASILLSMNTTGEYVLNIPRPLNTTQGLYQFAGH